MTQKSFKKGDKIETIHGEKLVVLDVRYADAVTKKGVEIKPAQVHILAESGGHPTWFPVEKLK